MSQFWTDENGMIGRITNTGSTQRIRPKKLARISDGHNVIHEVPTVWDQTFEQEYDQADSGFPRLVEWLSDLAAPRPISGRMPVYEPRNISDAVIDLFAQGLASLALRSPRYRDYAVSLAIRLRGPLEKAERKKITNINIRGKQADLAKVLKRNSKVAVYFSPQGEFIYGDGFYQTVPVSDVDQSPGLRILVPVTPQYAVFLVCPSKYRIDPKFVISSASSEVVKLINDTMQIYSGFELFFKGSTPQLSEHFRAGKYLSYNEPDPIQNLSYTIPGVIRSKVYRAGF
ncbi:MAG: hypothetical protein AAF569_07770 [Pseudomonadota bacterium]